MMRRAATAVCGAVMVVAATAHAEGVTVAPRHEEGRTLRYELRLELERELRMGAGHDRLVQEAGIALETTGVDGDGVATVAGDIEWVVIDLDRASFRVRVDSRDIVGDSPNLAETTIREMVAAYLDASFTVRVSPEGEVLELTGLDNVTSYIAEKKGTLPSLASGRLTPSSMAVDLAPVWSGDGAAGRTLSEGDSFEVSKETGLGAGASLASTTTFKVTGAGGGRASYEGAADVEVVLPPGEMPIEFSLENVEGKSSVVWDAELGALRTRDAMLGYTMTLSVKGNDGAPSQSSERSTRAVLDLVSPER